MFCAFRLTNIIGEGGGYSLLSRLYMKIIFLVLTLLLFFNIAFCDELRIPYSCFPQALQKEFKKNKLKLDLDPVKRNKKSWGYLKNEGSSYKIYTYRSTTPQDLSTVYKIASKVAKENK